MNYETITTARQLDQLCMHLAGASRLGLDTEFVSEHTYRPQLCLLQISTDQMLAVVDALAIEDLSPLWMQFADGPQETVVHAGREELSFCLEAVGRPLARLFDTQIAAGLVGSEYPAGYSPLMAKYLGVKAPKAETRTDWRRRPLAEEQISYAVEDVRHLLPLRDRLCEILQSLNRLEWMAAEMASWQEEVQQARTRQRWRKVAGTAGLSSRSLAIVRELWCWRDQQARERDVPSRRVLRDDLIVEIARRQSAHVEKIRAIRGLEHSVLRRALPQLADCVRQALQTPESELPQPRGRELPAQLNVISQFLTAALNAICQKAQVATSLVGTASDVRDLVASHLGFTTSGHDQMLTLTTGWRAEVVGSLLDDLLAGKRAVRIQDPRAAQPLAIEPVTGKNVR